MIALRLLLCGLVLSVVEACAHVSYNTKLADGSLASVSAWELGRSEALKELSADVSGKGANLNATGVKSDVNVEALQAGNSALGAIIGAAVKAYTGKP